jgi:hypothetical protein
VLQPVGGFFEEHQPAASTELEACVGQVPVDQCQ